MDPIASNSWQTLDIGAGGFVRNLDVASDGTMAARADTYGSYRWNGSEWVELITATSMPAAFLAANNTWTTRQGVYEIPAPIVYAIFYMMYDGYVFR